MTVCHPLITIAPPGIDNVRFTSLVPAKTSSERRSTAHQRPNQGPCQDLAANPTRRLAGRTDRKGQMMGNQALPNQPSALVDTERLSNGVTVVRCGRERDAIRASYDIGVTAYAYQRWAHAPVGDVLANRREHVYFLVEPGTAAGWDALLTSTGCQGLPIKPLGVGSIIVLPAYPRGSARRWLRGPGLGAARAAAVLESLRLANQRLICRAQQQIRDLEMAHLARIAAAVVERLPRLPG